MYLNQDIKTCVPELRYFESEVFWLTKENKEKIDEQKFMLIHVKPNVQ